MRPMTLDEAVRLICLYDEIEAKTKLAVALRLISRGIESCQLHDVEWTEDAKAWLRAVRSRVNEPA